MFSYHWTPRISFILIASLTKKRKGNKQQRIKRKETLHYLAILVCHQCCLEKCPQAFFHHDEMIK